MGAEEAFSKPEELLNHLRVSHPGQQPDCPKCKASFDFDDYISHLVSCFTNTFFCNCVGLNRIKQPGSHLFLPSLYWMRADVGK